jgi:hypothetical protein
MAKGVNGAGGMAGVSDEKHLAMYRNQYNENISVSKRGVMWRSANQWRLA